MVGTTLGHYRIVEPLGAGGMGQVYLARDTQLDRDVALKLLPPEVAHDPEHLSRLRREAKALAALDHPGIVTLFSVEEAGGTHFLTMARIRGRTLDSLIPPEGMPLELLLELGAALADALEAAHEQGIVHRDLKPSNVMVDASGRLRVLDFGLSRVVRKTEMSSQMATATVDEAMTRRGTVLGTVPYMSPEQAQGEPVGPASDLFSCGVVLYEMAAGRRPFQGESAAALVSSILRDTPVPLSELRPDLPESLAGVIARCLEKDPGQRVESAARLRDELEALRRQEILREAGRGTAPRLPASRAGRLGLGAVVLALVLGVGGLVWKGAERPNPAVGSEAAAEGIRSIAVLPLSNLSGDPEEQYFADGMTEALITELARFGALRVISRTSVMRFKHTELSLPEIARELGVDAVVEGSVQREAERVRISAQLIDAATDRHLWVETFERTQQGVLQLQSDVARSIANAIAVEVSPAEASRLAHGREVLPEVYEAYLRGMHFLDKGTPEGIERAMGFFRQAVDRDPVDPLAYAGLADGFVMLGHATGDAAYIRRAKEAARRALELDPSHADAQGVLATAAMFFDWDWDAAESAYERAIELNPSHSEMHSYYGFFLLLKGNFEKGAAEVELARELDPLSPVAAVWVAEFYWPFGRYQEAEEAALAALELNPAFPHAHAWLAQVYRGEGRLDEALEHARIAAAGNPRWVPWLGTVLVAGGHREEARGLLGELLANPGAGHTLLELSAFQIALGDLEGAMASVERAYETRSIFMPWIGSWADLGALTEDARFQGLLEKMNLDFVRPRLLAAAGQG